MTNRTRDRRNLVVIMLAPWLLAAWGFWMAEPIWNLPAPAGQSQCETDLECYGHGWYEIAGHIDGFENVGATAGDVR
jgi:hypothetical protein